MRNRSIVRLVCLAGGLAGLLLWGAASAAPLETAFRYQGRLMESGVPARGIYDLRFGLYPAEAGGSPWTAPVTNDAVAVADGIFTATLDFGTNVFSGAGCWLEISVRPAGQPGDFVTLRPRQPLTPAPYAIFTLLAERLSGTVSDAQLSTNVARLDADQTFRGTVDFSGPVSMSAAGGAAALSVQGELRAASLSGDGAGLSNVVAAALSARQMERFWRVPIPFVVVTNAGNEPDFTGKGAVPFNFRIGKYEINNHQYAVFLNAVAADDPHDLYSTNMSFNMHGGIERSGSPGEYAYTVKPGMGHRPVVWVDFYDALRFCNWLHHGQPAGAQDETTTEDGAYTLTAEAVFNQTVLRNDHARFWLPSDDEWYKAAYHQPAELGGPPGHYWLYPTRSNDAPFSDQPPGSESSANACCETGRMATDVGAYIYSPNFYGTFDQAGNVQEWTEWTNDFTFLGLRRVRGGSWYYDELYSKSTSFEFDTTDYDAESIGFRVAGAAP